MKKSRHGRGRSARQMEGGRTMAEVAREVWGSGGDAQRVEKQVCGDEAKRSD